MIEKFWLAHTRTHAKQNADKLDTQAFKKQALLFLLFSCLTSRTHVCTFYYRFPYLRTFFFLSLSPYSFLSLMFYITLALFFLQFITFSFFLINNINKRLCKMLLRLYGLFFSQFLWKNEKHLHTKLWTKQHTLDQRLISVSENFDFSW